MRFYRLKYLLLTLLFFLAFNMPITYASKGKPFVIVLDAGHGGSDRGNSHHGFVEKDIALSITLKVGAHLENDPRFKIIYTRDDDSYPTLDDRTVIANKAKADFFISIHCNAVGGGNQAYGVETFVLGSTRNKENLELAKRENSVIYLEENYEEVYGNFDPNSPSSLIGLTLAQEEYLDQSIQLASLVQQNITNNLNRRDRSVKQGPFYVLARTVMPSILIEVGFLSNRNEGAYLNSTKGQNQIANEIAKAIKSYRSALPDLHVSDYVETPATSTTDVLSAKDEVVFMVQIGASGTKMEVEPYNFKGLEGVHRVKHGELYKYLYGKTNSYNNAQALQKKAKESGFPDCFVVAFKNGEQVRLADVVQTN